MEKTLDRLYWYCTDFCIHIANLLGITYVEFNFWLFLVIFPAIVGILLFVNIYRYIFKKILRF